MKLLVLAQTPPPIHGQSVMVQTLVEGLPAHGFRLHHINFQLSRDAADIGRWRPGKVFATLAFAARTVLARFRHGCDTLYYIPSPPGKRGALYRDWVLMAVCRPFFQRLILHWHAAGLAAWLESRANGIERAVTRALLGRADLGIVLAGCLRGDAEALKAHRVAIVPNGIHDPGTVPSPPAAPPFRLLFLAACSQAKGVLVAAEAVVSANRRVRARAEAPAFTLTAAGTFDDFTTAARFAEISTQHRGWVEHAGFIDGEAKRQLFTRSHALCFPTRYAAEGQPLVVMEALAHDRPVVATTWRALPDMITPDVGRLVPPGDEAALVEALLALRSAPPAPGACRRRFLEHFTIERHMAQLTAALREAAGQ